MAQVNIRIDDELKNRGEILFNELGISMSAAVNMFVAQAVREGGIPFSVTTQADPFYSKSNMDYLRKVISDIDAGKANLVEHDLIED